MKGEQGKASATRLTTWRVRESSTLPPLTLLPGHGPSQEQKALALRHLLISTPISEAMSSTRPTTLVRSIPQMRSNRPARSILGSLALGLCFLLAFSPKAGLDSLSGAGVVAPSFAVDGLSPSSFSLAEAAWTCWASFCSSGSFHGRILRFGLGRSGRLASFGLTRRDVLPGNQPLGQLASVGACSCQFQKYLRM